MSTERQDETIRLSPGSSCDQSMRNLPSVSIDATVTSDPR